MVPGSGLCAAESSESRTSLYLLGGFGIDRSARSPSLPLSAQRLVAYLAIHRRPQSRELLAEWLWPNRTPEVARLNLRQALFVERSRCGGLVRATRDELCLEPSVAVDLHEVIAEVRQLLATPVIAPGFDPSRLVHDLLPTWDEKWLESERERFRELRLHGLEALAEFWLRSGCWARAIEIALIAVDVDPLRESGRALLIRAYLAERNLARAVAVYESYRDCLRRELDAHPSTELLRLLTGGSHDHGIPNNGGLTIG